MTAKSESRKQPVDNAELATDFLRRWSFYGLHRFFSNEERDAIVEALNRPLLQSVPSEKSIRADERARCAAEIYAAAGDGDAECYTACDAADLLSGVK